MSSKTSDSQWSSVNQFLTDNAARFEEQLKALIRIPSVSAQPAHNSDTRQAAEFVRDDLITSGIDARLVETAGHPIVVGRPFWSMDITTFSLPKKVMVGTQNRSSL